MAKKSDGGMELGLALCRVFGLDADSIAELTVHRARDGQWAVTAVHVEIKDGKALDTLRRYELKEVSDDTDD